MFSWDALRLSPDPDLTGEIVPDVSDIFRSTVSLFVRILKQMLLIF
jgi:hypothetical protein